MKKLSKKAFTLIEILGAITILGILSIVAIISVNKIIQRARNEHYKTAEKNFTLAAQSYVQQNRKELPKVIGQREKVYLKTLIDNNYIEKILDYRKKECNTDQSYVQIFKYSQTDYSYIAILKCPDPQYDGNDIVTGKNNANININFDEDADVKDANATIKITEPNKIFSYSYTVYRNGKEVKSSGDQFVENYDTEVTKKLKLDEYSPGKIKIVVTSTNIYGIPTTTTSTHEFKDLNPPECVILDEKDKDKNRDWTNQDRKITIGCDDGRGTGCTRQTYSKTFKSDTPDGTITIKDESGKTTKCKVIVNLDKTAPTCSVSFSGTNGDNGWFKEKAATVTLNRNDNLSGVATYGLTTSSTTTYNNSPSSTQGDTASTTWYGYAKDKAGNTVSCNNSLKVDTKAPSCSVSGGNASWTNGSRTVTGTCSDSLSGCVGNISKVYDTNTNSTTAGANGLGSGGSVKDNAGNVTNCSANQTVKIDKTKPTISWSTSAGPHQDSDGGTFTVKTTCTDALSGVASHTGSSTVSSPTSGTKKTHYCTDNAGNKASTSRTFKVQIFSADATACGYKSCVNDSCTCNSPKRCCKEEVCGANEETTKDSCEFIVPQISVKEDCKKCDGFSASQCDCGYSTPAYALSGQYVCNCKCKKTTKTPKCCRDEGCGCDVYNSCVAEVCGAESCWHY